MDVTGSSRATKMTLLAISEMVLSVYSGSLKIRTILASILPPCTGQVYAREPCGLMLHFSLERRAQQVVNITCSPNAQVSHGAPGEVML